MGWLRPAEWGAGILLALVVLFAAAAVAGLFLRRRVLSSVGGVFDCAMRRGGSSRWSTGFARYHGDDFQWFRTFSVAVGPSLVVPRIGTHIVESRSASVAELKDLGDLGQVLVVEYQGRAGSRRAELAMLAASATGMMSWIEAAPPGRPVSP